MTTHGLRHVVGCMTGTSLDGLDAALVAITGQGLAMRARLVGMVSWPLDEVRPALAELAQGHAMTPLAILRTARRLGQLHADAIAKLLADHLPPGASADFVVAHGQTVWHAPDEHLSWQLMDPWPIARQRKLPVLYDLRQADLIAQGQGAPITPLADWVLYRHPQHPRAIVNLGGICNVTLLPPGQDTPDTLRGGDVGPCNLLLDGLVQRLHPGLRYDAEGRLAAPGQSHECFTQWVRQSPFFDRPMPRTTGREDFNAAWVDRLLSRATQAGWSPADILASAAQAVAQIIAAYLHEHEQSSGCPADMAMDVVVAGGGACHPGLLAALRQALGSRRSVLTSEDVGLPVAAREAVGLAVLGALSRDGVSITCPAITGADRPGLAGAWVLP